MQGTRISFDRSPEERTVHIDVGATRLEGTLGLPAGARGVVLFAHGSGSSRHSPRNRFVAQWLRNAGLGTLLLDLLSPDEETLDLQTNRLRFDIGLLASRLVGALDWLKREPDTSALAIGLFGASTGAAAALVAAAERPEAVAAVVSRGGRPDLAGRVLPVVQAPTRLIVGSNDPLVLDLNRSALAAMRTHADLVVVPGATHLFEERGALERVAAQASEWFLSHLGARSEVR